MLKYRALYDRYKELLANGTYGPGERLPSMRAVAETEGLGLNTVRSAFDLLERDGLVRPLERGGYYVRSRAGLPALVAPRDACVAESSSAFQKIEYLLAAGGAAAGFALAEPDPALLPTARLERLHASLSGSWIDYGDQSGEEELRRRIAAIYHPYLGGLDLRDILITNGATEAISLAIRAFVQAGDEVVVESPTYYDLFRHLAAARARIIEVPVRVGSPSGRGGGMDLDILEASLKSHNVRMIIVQPNVQNPTGTIMEDGDKRRLVEVAAKSGAILVQDDVYGDLAFAPPRPANLSAFGDYERLVYLSSFSKSLAPGLRIGWMRAAGLRADVARVKSLTSLSTSRPAQRVLAAYLGGSSFRRHLAHMRAALETQLAEYLEILSGALPPGSSVARPAGGCLLWAALPGGSDASRIFAAAAREGILVAPGELFSTNPFFRGHIRINFGYRLSDRSRAKLRRLCAIARDQA